MTLVSPVAILSQALAVTGQNISNINTDGYKRRLADLENAANKDGISSTNSQTGLGVRVAGIRRSFDEFLLNKARAPPHTLDK